MYKVLDLYNHLYPTNVQIENDFQPTFWRERTDDAKLKCIPERSLIGIKKREEIGS